LRTKEQEFIKKNWGKVPLENISKNVSISMYELLKTAYKMNLHKNTTPDIGRRWSADEDKFLKEYADRIRIPEACNLLYRSRYATYQRVKFLNLEQMIGK
jgi:hypothetical protein